MPELYDTLVIDIGGTNIRLGLLEKGDARPVHIQNFHIDPFPGLGDVIGHYLADAPPHKVTEAAVAVATPVTGDLIRLTNHDWSFSIKAVREQFGYQRVKVINDFTALALSIPLLSQDELQLVGGR